MLDVIKPFILEGDASKLGVGLFILMPEGRAITFLVKLSILKPWPSQPMIEN